MSTITGRGCENIFLRWADSCLTHWGRVMHICVGNLTIIGSDNDLSPGRRQAIIWTNDVILWFRPLGTNFSEILIEFLTFWFKKMRLNVSFAKWRPFCLGLNVLNFSRDLKYQHVSPAQYEFVLVHIPWHKPYGTSRMSRSYSQPSGHTTQK